MMSRFLGAAGIAAMFVFAQPAAAATVSYAYDFSMNGTYNGSPVIEEFLFPTFESTLGQLRAFTAQVDVNYQYGAFWDQSQMVRGSYQWNLRYKGWNMFVALSQGDYMDHDYMLMSLPHPDRDQGERYDAGPGNVGSYDSGLVEIRTAQTNTSAHDLALLSGSGPRYVNLFLEGLTVSQECLSATCGPMSTYGSAQHRVTLTYTYDAAVPEPATWALMILGFGGVGAALRRRGTSLPA